MLCIWSEPLGQCLWIVSTLPSRIFALFKSIVITYNLPSFEIKYNHSWFLIFSCFHMNVGSWHVTITVLGSSTVIFLSTDQNCFPASIIHSQYCFQLSYELGKFLRGFWATFCDFTLSLCKPPPFTPTVLGCKVSVMSLHIKFGGGHKGMTRVLHSVALSTNKLYLKGHFLPW